MENELNEIMESIREELVETITHTETNIIVFESCVKLPKTDFRFIPTKFCKIDNYRNVTVIGKPNPLNEPMNLYKNMLTETFYKVTQLSPSKLYMDDIQLSYVEKGLYEDEKKAHYRRYSRDVVVSFIFLPCMLLANTFSFLYNAAISPYLFFRYYHNPPYYYYHIHMILRRSMVE